jgi:peptidyl-prolyl cis-trans isomerase D
MMQALRRSTKTIMIVVAAAFVIGFIFLQLGVNVTGRSGTPVISALGSVNGVEINLSMYNEMRSQLLMQTRQSKGSITDEDYLRVEEDVWDEIIYQILLQQEIERMDIKVTDDEILEEMKNNPPDFLRTNEAFLTEGEFDQTKYLQALYSPQNEMFVIELENWFRNVLPIQKLQNYLFSTIHITDKQLRDEFKVRNEKVKVEYLSFKPDVIVTKDAVEVSDEEIESYYRDNRSEYKTEKKVILEYVEFPILPNKEDSLETNEVIEEIKVLLADGTPFEEVASAYSQDPLSAEKGGDLGWMTRGRMVKPVEDAAFSLKKGEISDPVASQFGFHIIKLEDKKKTEERGEEVRARHILVRLEPSYITIGDISDRANEIRDKLADSADFYAVADSLVIDIKTTNPVSRGEHVPEIGPTRIPAVFAFTQSVGDISNVLKIGERYLFCRVKQILPEGYKQLEDVRGDIEQKILSRKMMEESMIIAERALERIIETGDLEFVAGEFGVEYAVSDEIARRTIVQGVGRYTEFTGTAFGLTVGEISSVIELPDALYILKVLEKIGVEEEAFEQAKEGLRLERENFQRNTAMSNWYEALKEAAEIEDNRELFFQQS